MVLCLHPRNKLFISCRHHGNFKRRIYQYQRGVLCLVFPKFLYIEGTEKNKRVVCVSMMSPNSNRSMERF